MLTSALVILALLLAPALAIAADPAAVPAGFPPPSFFAGIATEKVAPIAGLIVTLLVQIMKGSAFSGWIKTIDRRKRILVPLGLSALVGVVGPWLGIVGWDDAVKLALETAASSVFLGEAVISQMMGQRTGEAPPKSAPPPAPAPDLAVTEVPPPGTGAA